MQRAQWRDAAATKSFFFRKDVYTTNPSAATSIASSSGSSSPVNGYPTRKEKKLTNRFAPPPSPERGFDYGPVEEEYEEMTMMEIMNGKVSITTLIFVRC
jgi:glutamate--cysteine ligase catalytic subunit